jgi:hypothetical protein
MRAKLARACVRKNLEAVTRWPCVDHPMQTLTTWVCRTKRNSQEEHEYWEMIGMIISRFLKETDSWRYDGEPLAVQRRCEQLWSGSRGGFLCFSGFCFFSIVSSNWHLGTKGCSFRPAPCPCRAASPAALRPWESKCRLVRSAARAACGCPSRRPRRYYRATPHRGCRQGASRPRMPSQRTRLLPRPTSPSTRPRERPRPPPWSPASRTSQTFTSGTMGTSRRLRPSLSAVRLKEPLFRPLPLALLATAALRRLKAAVAENKDSYGVAGR